MTDKQSENTVKVADSSADAKMPAQEAQKKDEKKASEESMSATK